MKQNTTYTKNTKEALQPACGITAACMRHTCSLHAAYLQPACGIPAACMRHTSLYFILYTNHEVKENWFDKLLKVARNKLPVRCLIVGSDTRQQ